MRKIRWFSALAGLVTVALASCGGGSCDSSFAGSCSSGTTGPTVSSVLLVSDSSTIPSDNSLTAKLTAYVRDANNNFLVNVPVLFTVNNGGLSVTQGTTDANGVATATLNTLGDPTNRTITITATASKVVATITVDVTGTSLQITNGPSTLTTGQAGSYTVALTDSAGHGISGRTVTVSAPSQLSGAPATVVTDQQGNATINGTGSGSGSGNLSVTALGLTASKAISINGDSLTFSTPPGTPAPDIPLNVTQAYTVTWVQAGVPVNAAQINVATTRGCIYTGAASSTCVVSAGPPVVTQPSSATVTTDASGNATFTVVSDDAGGAAITATVVVGGTTANVSAQFIATVPASIDVQPDAFTIPANSPDKITAVVRDANNNLVTNAVVAFSLVDTTGGTLSVPSAVTNQQGRASTTYTAGSSSSASNGVHVTATVQGTAISKTVDLTVAKVQAFITLGTGNQIKINNNGTQYEKDYIVQVTDINGAGVANVPMTFKVIPDYYYKGYRILGATDWGTCYTVPGPDVCPPSVPVNTVNGCANEDVNHNGILDTGPGNYTEDNNGNGMLDPSNVATVGIVSPSTTAVTDANGFLNIGVFYPEQYAYYVDVTLQAQAQVQGTNFSAQNSFMLLGAAADFKGSSATPPGPVSPFGRSNSCTDTL